MQQQKNMLTLNASNILLASIQNVNFKFCPSPSTYSNKLMFTSVYMGVYPFYFPLL